MDVLTCLAIGLMVIGAITIAGIVLPALIIWLTRPRPRRAPVSAAMVLEEMAEQRVPSAELPCRCKVYLLPDGDTYTVRCRRHSSMSDPDFTAWLN